MHVKKDLTIKDFMEMNELEKLFYSEEHITSPEEVQKWYENFPNAGIVMEDKGKIIGFTDVFPIKDHIYEALKEGVFNDKNLESEDIIDMESLNPGEKINMFLCCLVILPEYRKTSALTDMLKAHIQYYDQFVKKGIVIENVITDNVSKAGERFSKRMGFEKVTDTIYESVIYMKSYKAFVEILKD